MVKTQFNKQVKILRSDNGSEFTCLTRFYADNGILHQTSCVETPQQNGRVERKHRHILIVARALRFQANLPISFWGECIMTAAYLINRTPTPLLDGKTPYDMLFDQTPSYNTLRVFDCLCFAKNRPRTKDKFGSRTRKCIFVGYPYGKKGWRLYDLESKDFFVSRDVIFCEDKFPYTEQSESGVDDAWLEYMAQSYTSHNNAISDDDEIQPNGHMGVNPLNEGKHNILNESLYTPLATETANSPNQQQLNNEATSAEVPIVDRGSVEGVMELGRGHRLKKPSNKLQGYITSTVRHINPVTSSAPPDLSRSSGTPFPIACYVSCDKFYMKHKHFLAAITVGHEPTSFSAAVKDPKWRKTMQEEIDALERNGTWTVEDRSSSTDVTLDDKAVSAIVLETELDCWWSFLKL